MSRITERDRRWVWHPFALGDEDVPIAIESAQGVWLTDSSGRRYLDLIGSWWVCLHGHGRREIIDAVHAQARRLDHVLFAGFTHRPGADLAHALVRRTEGAMQRVFYSDNGSSAVECALKIAWQYWRNLGQTDRTRFIALEGGYHGDTLGAMSAGFSSGFYGPFEDLRLPFTFTPGAPTFIGDNGAAGREETALARLEALLDEPSAKVAAVIVEPLIQGAAGMRMSSPDFLRRLSEIVRRSGALLIFDEVFTGFGRTGSMFAFLKAECRPDILCLAKGMTGGVLPLAATLCREPIHQAFLDPAPGDSGSRPFVHGHSYTANPLGCAAALAALALFDQDDSLARIAAIETIHRRWLNDITSLPHLRRPRVMGSVAAFDIESGRDGDTAYASAFSRRLRARFLDHGLLLRPLGSTVYLTPPYTIDPEELDRAWAAIANIVGNIDDL